MLLLHRIVPAMTGIADSEAQKEMGSRLRVVREVLELSQQEMAEGMGVGVTALSAWENGRNQIDIIKLARAAARWGFSTDWVAMGDLSGIRKDLADKLEDRLSLNRSGGGPRRGRPPKPTRSAACIVPLAAKRAR